MGLGHHRLDEGDFGVVVAQNQCAGEHFRFFLQFRAAHVQGVNPHGGHAGALGLEGGAGDHVPVGTVSSPMAGTKASSPSGNGSSTQSTSRSEATGTP